MTARRRIVGLAIDPGLQTSILVFGEEHRFTADPMDTLASVLEKQGKFEEAIEIY